MIKATFVALKGIQAPRSVAAKRGKRVSDILGTRRDNDAATEEAAAN
jgi:small subunit ribosomal protein S5